MTQLGNGLHDTKHFEDALTVQEAELSMKRRLGAPDESILTVQGNLANTYDQLGRYEEALRTHRDVYSSHVRLFGEEHRGTFLVAENYALALLRVRRFEEAKSLLREAIPVARRVLGENHEHTLKLRALYARALHEDTCATLGRGDVRGFGTDHAARARRHASGRDDD